MRLPIFLLSIFYLTFAEELHVPDIDDFTVIKEKCEKAGGSYDELKIAKDSFQTCVTNFANVSAVQNEIEEAKKTGSMDEVFGKYCSKKAKLTECVESFTGKMRACLNGEEKNALNVTLEILRQLGDFVCFRDGDRIAMFIAEGGVDCIKEHVEGIKSCINTTLKIEPTTVNTNTLPTFLIDKKKCEDLGKLQNCVVHDLEKCKDSTPANIVDALFKFIKKSACPTKQKRSVDFEGVIQKHSKQLDLNPKSYFLDVFHRKCNENAPEGGYEAFTLNLESALHCIKNMSKDEPLLDTPLITYKENLNRCTRKLLEKTSACLAEEEKYWPQFYFNIVENMLDFLYANKNDLIHLPKMEVYNCLQNFKSEKARQQIKTCFEISEMGNLKKEAVCSSINKLENCLSTEIEARCIKDVTVNKLTKDFFKALSNSCNN